jgi:hypothetical protein
MPFRVHLVHCCRGKFFAALLRWQYAARWMLLMGTNWGGGLPHGK